MRAPLHGELLPWVVRSLVGKHRDEARGLLRERLPQAVADTVGIQEHGGDEEISYEEPEFPGAVPSCLALGVGDDGVVTANSFWCY